MEKTKSGVILQKPTERLSITEEMSHDCFAS